MNRVIDPSRHRPSVWRQFGLLALAALWPSAEALAQSPPVARNAAELVAAMARAEGGSIALAPGQYDEIRLQRVTPTKLVKIVPLDPASPPVLGRVAIVDSSNIALEGLTLKPQPAGGGRFGFVIDIARSDNIGLSRLRIEGDPEAQKARARGISVTDSTNIGIVDSVLTDLDRGAVFSRSRNLVVAHNLVTRMIVDGFNFAEVEDVKITSNRLESFTTGPDHPDFIQFWTNGTKKPSKNILIAGNLLQRGDGNTVQGIFMGNEVPIRYENVTIRDNIIIQESPHGLAVFQADNVWVENNVVLSVAEARYKVAIRLAGVQNGVVRGNTSTAFDLARMEGSQSGNTTIGFGDKQALREAENRVRATLAERKFENVTVGGLPVGAHLRIVGPR